MHVTDKQQDGSSFGMKVFIRFANGRQSEYRNITEIHSGYDDYDGNRRIAFESDIHGTGFTWPKDDILEYEATLETSKAETL